MQAIDFKGFLQRFKDNDFDLENYRFEPKIKIALPPFLYVKITNLKTNQFKEFRILI